MKQKNCESTNFFLHVVMIIFDPIRQLNQMDEYSSDLLKKMELKKEDTGFNLNNLIASPQGYFQSRYARKGRDLAMTKTHTNLIPKF
jgi:hypothetical protein